MMKLVKFRNEDEIYKTSLKERVNYSVIKFFWKCPRFITLIDLILSVVFFVFYAVCDTVLVSVLDLFIAPIFAGIIVLCDYELPKTLCIVLFIYNVLFLFKTPVLNLVKYLDGYFTKMISNMLETNEPKYWFLKKHVPEEIVLRIEDKLKSQGKL